MKKGSWEKKKYRGLSARVKYRKQTPKVHLTRRKIRFLFPAGGGKKTAAGSVLPFRPVPCSLAAFRGETIWIRLESRLFPRWHRRKSPEPSDTFVWNFSIFPAALTDEIQAPNNRSRRGSSKLLQPRIAFKSNSTRTSQTRV